MSPQQLLRPTIKTKSHSSPSIYCLYEVWTVCVFHALESEWPSSPAVRAGYEMSRAVNCVCPDVSFAPPIVPMRSNFPRLVPAESDAFDSARCILSPRCFPLTGDGEKICKRRKFASNLSRVRTAEEVDIVPQTGSLQRRKEKSGFPLKHRRLPPFSHFLFPPPGSAHFRLSLLTSIGWYFPLLLSQSRIQTLILSRRSSKFPSNRRSVG